MENFRLVFILASLVLANCGKNNPLSVVPQTQMTLTAAIDNTDRTGAAHLFAAGKATPVSFQVVIQKIEIRKGPQTAWENIYEGGGRTEIAGAAKVLLTNGQNVEGGLYQGVRVTYRNDWSFRVTSPTNYSTTNSSGTTTTSTDHIWATKKVLTYMIEEGILSSAATNEFSLLEEEIYLDKEESSMSLIFNVNNILQFDWNGTNASTIHNLEVLHPSLRLEFGE